MQNSQELILAAKQAAAKAYAPYSKFPVGAAIRTKSGRIFAGCNVENASFGLTICAERNAIFQAVAAGEQEIEAVVIYTPTSTATAPCGACRQVINEFGANADVLCVCDSDSSIDLPMHALLPRGFGATSV